MDDGRDRITVSFLYPICRAKENTNKGTYPHICSVRLKKKSVSYLLGSLQEKSTLKYSPSVEICILYQG